MKQANSQPQIMVAHKTLHVLQRINVEGIHIYVKENWGHAYELAAKQQCMS